MVVATLAASRLPRLIAVTGEPEAGGPEAADRGAGVSGGEIRGLCHSLHPSQQRSPVGQGHGDDVDAVGTGSQTPRRLSQSPRLVLGDLGQRVDAATSLHLDGDEVAADPRQHVDLTTTRTQVARQYLGAAAGEEGGGQALAEAP